jgi:hypothetical protein
MLNFRIVKDETVSILKPVALLIDTFVDISPDKFQWSLFNYSSRNRLPSIQRYGFRNQFKIRSVSIIWMFAGLIESGDGQTDTQSSLIGFGRKNRQTKTGPRKG